MDKVYVVCGYGPNDIIIPCRIFKTVEEAQSFIDSDPPMSEVFTSYYDGCGECDSLRVKEVAFNTPFIGWNLD